MPWDEKQHDVASSACHTLKQVLKLPSCPSIGDEYDREAHEAFTMLSIVPDAVRERWMTEYGINPAVWLAWAAVAQIVADAEKDSQRTAGGRS